MSVLVSLVLAFVLGSADARLPLDYRTVTGLSQPRYATAKHVERVPMADGVHLYVEVVRPTASGRFPVVMVATPYNGTLHARDAGTYVRAPKAEGAPNPGIAGYFPPRGYAYVSVDLRGTGKSEGCIDHLGPKDASDLKAIVEWAARQPWANGKVGMVGHSYEAATAIVAASQRPKGLATIVPSAGLATMYDHQFQAGVPFTGAFNGPIFGYELLTVMRSLPPGIEEPVLGSSSGDSFGMNLRYTGCGLPTSAGAAGPSELTGTYSKYFQDRDHRAGATAADIPIFIIQGMLEHTARPMVLDWFNARGGRRTDKVWINQADHGGYDRTIQWTRALHAWFDRHLAGRPVDTGPRVEVFVTDEDDAAAEAGAQAEAFTLPAWPPPARTIELFPSPGKLLARAAPATAGSQRFVGTPLDFAGPILPPVEYLTPPFDRDTVLAGVPELRLVASFSTARTDLLANLWAVKPDGSRKRVGHFALNPWLRDGDDHVAAVVPGTGYALELDPFPVAYRVHAGERLALTIATSDIDKLPVFAADRLVTIYTGPNLSRLRIPVVDNVRVVRHPGLPALPNAAERGAPPPDIHTSVAAPVPSFIVPAYEYIEFAVPRGTGASMHIEAVPDLPADIDLVVERRADEGGAWSSVVIEGGGSSDLTQEVADAKGPLAAGRYRVGVANFLGVPGTPITVDITFPQR